MTELLKMNLVNIGQGTAQETFQEELKRVFANIADVNTEATAKRSIKLEFLFQPNEDRNQARITISSSSKLAGVKRAQTDVFLAKQAGEFFAVENNPAQALLQFEQPPTPIRAVEGGKEKE